MKNDVRSEVFFADEERFADVINAFGCEGRQVVQKEDLQELDSKVRFLPFALQGRSIKRKSTKIRDLVRRTAFGINFAVVGIENQETIDYSMALRTMIYEAGEYERQAGKIRKYVRKNRNGLSAGEYLYGFKKESRLHPAVTFILYYGEKEWDGAVDLHGILDFTDIPKSIKKLVQNYKIHVISVFNLTDEETGRLKTDVKQVFDFIRCSKSPDKLKKLVGKNSAYREMEEDAFDMAIQYTHADNLIQKKEYYRRGDKVNMCEAIEALIKEGKTEGKAENILELLEDCGSVPKELQKRIMEEKDLDILKKWLKLAAKAETVEEFVGKM